MKTLLSVMYGHKITETKSISKYENRMWINYKNVAVNYKAVYSVNSVKDQNKTNLVQFGPLVLNQSYLGSTVL